MVLSRATTQQVFSNNKCAQNDLLKEKLFRLQMEFEINPYPDIIYLNRETKIEK